MLLGKTEQLDNAHAYTATAISTNVVDLGPVTLNTTRDLGAGEPVYLSILVTTTVAATGGASTAVFTLESDSDTSLSTSATVHWTGQSIAKATLVAGYWYAKAVPIPAGNYERYVGIRFTPATNDWTSGAVSAWLHKGRFDTTVYASGVSNNV